MQEIANRGIQEQLPPEKLEIFNEAIARGLISMPDATGFEQEAAVGAPVQVGQPTDSLSQQIQAAASAPNDDDLRKAILNRKFSPSEIELWKRDNLSAPKAGKMDDRRAINLMRVDLIEELQDPSVTEQVVSGLGQGARSLGQEGLKIGASVGDTIGLVEPETRQQLSEDINLQRKTFDESKVGQMPITKGAKFVGEVLPTMVIPGGVAGGLLRKTLAGAAGGGLSGVFAPTEDADIISGDRLENIALGTALGGGLPLAAGGVKNVFVDWPRMFSQKGGRLEIEKPFKALVSKAEQKELDAAAEEIGVFLSPAERTKTLAQLQDAEKGIRLDDQSALDLQIALQGRERTVQKTIKELAEEIAPQTGKDGARRAQAITEGYQAIAALPLPKSLINKVRNDDILSESLDDMLTGNSRASKIAQMEIKKLRGGQALIDNANGVAVADDVLNDVSLSVMDVFNKFVKEEVSTIANANNGKIGRVGRYMNNSLKETMDLVDSASPEYALARREASLNFARSNLEKRISKIKGGAIDEVGEAIPSSVQFFRSTLKSQNDFDNLLRELGDNHPARKKAAQLRVVLGAMENSPLEKVFRKTDPTGSISGGSFGKTGVALKLVGAAQRRNYYKGMVDYITDPNITDSLLDDAADIASKREPNLIELDEMGDMFLKMLSRVSPENATTLLGTDEQE